ncbi:hypothetical protein D9M68_918850 [compost metagenome]
MGSVFDGVVCAMALKEPARSMAPSGNMAAEAVEGVDDAERAWVGRRRDFRWDMVSTS